MAIGDYVAMLERQNKYLRKELHKNETRLKGQERSELAEPIGSPQLDLHTLAELKLLLDKGEIAISHRLQFQRLTIQIAMALGVPCDNFASEIVHAQYMELGKRILARIAENQSNYTGPEKTAPHGSARSSFDQWISAPPYERETERWPMDETKHAWPGQYKDIAVQLAWEAWCESSNEKLRHGENQ
jgi:hypothetical protein